MPRQQGEGVNKEGQKEAAGNYYDASEWSEGIARRNQQQHATNEEVW